jgi:hypothetical protein
MQSTSTQVFRFFYALVLSVVTIFALNRCHSSDDDSAPISTTTTTTAQTPARLKVPALRTLGSAQIFR